MIELLLATQLSKTTNGKQLNGVSDAVNCSLFADNQLIRHLSGTDNENFCNFFSFFSSFISSSLSF